MNAQDLEKANELNRKIEEYEDLKQTIHHRSWDCTINFRGYMSSPSKEIELPKDVWWAMKKHINHQLLAFRKELQEL